MSKDPYLALLSYWATPLPWCNLCPSELCMGRRLRTLIPQLLVPNLVYHKMCREKNKQFKESQKKKFDKRHWTRELTPIPENTDVWITSEDRPIQGTVVSPADSPRSYVVSTPAGLLHRNRSHLNVVPEKSQSAARTTIRQPGNSR